ncbi:MAG TPA: DUF6691 family protein [Solimonas sp.]|nr:DUF6691 family protein [Solimonas sp.]
MKTLAALFAGILFGFGLALAGMTDPARIVAFLDISGNWDPTLAFVMGTALLVTLPVFHFARRNTARPLFAARFDWPTRKDIDAPLLAGAALFGIGWGLTGLCPGPALAGLITALPALALFVVAMLAGMWLHDRVRPLR